MLPMEMAVIWQPWHLYQNGIVGKEKGGSVLWEIFTFLAKVIINKQENLNL